MGRKLAPISRDGRPETEFALRLRWRLELNPGLSLRQIAPTAGYSHSTLAAAVSGKKLPSWPVTRALVKACGDGEMVDQWQELWQETYLQVEKRIPPELVRETSGSRSALALKPKVPRREASNAWQPRPEVVQNFAQLADELRRFRSAIGSPTLEAVHRATVLHGGKKCSPTTLSDVFAGKRPPRLPAYRPMIQMMLVMSNVVHGDREKEQAWKNLDEWLRAWSRAEYARKYPDDAAALGGATPDHHTVLSELPESALQDPRLAAEFLARMEPSTVGDIITSLPQRTGKEILTTFLEMSRQA